MELSPGEPVDKNPLLGSDGTIVPSPGNTGNPAPAQTDQASANELGNASGVGETAGSATQAPSSESAVPTTTVSQLDIEILPTIYEIIRSVEKDYLETSAKQGESTKCFNKILELQRRFESAREQIKQLPGIDFNKEEQLQKLEQLGNQYKLKKQLLIKYRNNKF